MTTLPLAKCANANRSLQNAIAQLTLAATNLEMSDYRDHSAEADAILDRLAILYTKVSS